MATAAASLARLSRMAPRTLKVFESDRSVALAGDGARGAMTASSPWRAMGRGVVMSIGVFLGLLTGRSRGPSLQPWQRVTRCLRATGSLWTSRTSRPSWASAPAQSLTRRSGSCRAATGSCPSPSRRFPLQCQHVWGVLFGMPHGTNANRRTRYDLLCVLVWFVMPCPQNALRLWGSVCRGS